MTAFSAWVWCALTVLSILCSAQIGMIYGSKRALRRLERRPPPLAGQRWHIQGCGEVQITDVGSQVVSYLLPSGRLGQAKLTDFFQAGSYRLSSEYTFSASAEGQAGGGAPEEATALQTIEAVPVVEHIIETSRIPKPIPGQRFEVPGIGKVEIISLPHHLWVQFRGKDVVAYRPLRKWRWQDPEPVNVIAFEDWLDHRPIFSEGS